MGGDLHFFNVKGSMAVVSEPGLLYKSLIRQCEH